MKLIKAVVRPEKETAIMQALEQAGLPALTKWDVLGRGRQRGIQVGPTVYHDLARKLHGDFSCRKWLADGLDGDLLRFAPCDRSKESIAKNCLCVNVDTGAKSTIFIILVLT